MRILDETIKFVHVSQGEQIVLEKISLGAVPDNPLQNKKNHKAFALLSAGETTGVFQLEGPKMREYIQQLAPTRIEDIMAMVALYRPGPMESIPEFIEAKYGRKKVRYIDPRMSEWLDESYGVIVYQDQVLFIAVNIAGFSWGKAHKFRKALSKKKMDEVAGYRIDFIQGCIKNDIKLEDAEQLFTLIEPFGGYGFNKPHAASYAVVAFYCAYLKANYTAEFMAATLTAVSSDATKIANAIAECKRMKVEVFGPDINASNNGFVVANGGVRFGLLAIKGIGDGPINEIVRVRNEGGSFKSLADFCSRVNSKTVGKGGIETLIKAGAFDSIEGNNKRHQMLASVDRAMQFGKGERAAKDRGMISLFGELEEISNFLHFALTQNVEEIPRKQLLTWEKDLIGIYISSHPLSYIAELVKDKITHTIADLTIEMDKQKKVTLCGMIKEVRRYPTKKGDMMCAVQLEDMFGSINLTIFPRTYTEVDALLVIDTVVIVWGDIQVREEKLGLLCSGISVVDSAEDEMNRSRYMVWLHIHLTGNDERSESNDVMKVQAMKDILSHHIGRDHYEILVVHRDWEILLTPQPNTLAYSRELHVALEAVLGLGAVEVKILS